MGMVSLGNDQLNDLMSGGIKKQHSCIISGQNKSHILTMVQQCLTCRKNKQLNIAYITIEKSPESLFSEKSQPSFDKNYILNCANIKLIEIAIPDRAIENNNMNKLLLSIQLQLDAINNDFNMDCLILDSLLPSTLSILPNQNKRFFSSELLKIIQTNSCTNILLLFNTSLLNHLIKTSDQVDQFIQLDHEEEHGFTKHHLTIISPLSSRRCYRYILNSIGQIQFQHQLC